MIPPQINSNNLDPTSIPASDDFPQYDKSNDRRNALSAESEEVNSKGLLPPSTSVEPPKLLPTYNEEFRRREEARLKQLGLPLQSTNQFTNQQSVSQFSASSPQKPKAAQPVASQSQFTTKPPTQQTTSRATTTTRSPSTTTRSRPVTSKVTASSSSSGSIFKKQPTPLDLDKNYKAFEHILQFNKKGSYKDYDFSRYFTKKPINVESSAPVQQRRQDFSTERSVQVTTTTTTRPTTTRKAVVNFNQQPTTAQRFAPSGFVAASTTIKPFVKVTTTSARTTTTTTRRPLPSNSQPPRVQFANNKFQQNNNQFNSNVNSLPLSTSSVAGGLKEPSRDLLPPFDAVRNYDDITTRGPAAYYEWKVPDRFVA